MMTAFYRWLSEEGKTEEERKLGEEMYKAMKKETRKARRVIQGAISTSSELGLLDYINKLEKKRPNPYTARIIYQNLLKQLEPNPDLYEIARVEFKERFNIAEMLMNKGTIVVYEDLIRIDACGLYPSIHRDVEALISKLNERGTVILTNFPFRLYRIIADAQRSIWNLCRKEKTI